MAVGTTKEVVLLVHRHLLSRRLRNAKEPLLDIRQPNMLFVCLPKGSDIPYYVEPVFDNRESCAIVWA